MATRSAAGRPQFKPTKAQRQTVEALMYCAVPIKQARECIINPETGKPLSYTTFIRVFNDEIRIAVDTGNGKVARNLFRIATGNGPQACDAAKYWLRCKAGWKFANDDNQQKPPATDAPDVYTNEQEVEQRVAELWSRYGRTGAK